MKKILLAAAVVLAASGALAEDSPELRAKEADRYLSVVPPRDVIDPFVEQMSFRVPPERRAVFKSGLVQNLDMAALTKAMKDAMVSRFTVAEMALMVNFYGSETGKSALRKLGDYWREVQPTIQAALDKAARQAETYEPSTPSNP